MCRSNATELIRLLHNMEDVLATNDQFLLGRWLESAKAQATTSSDRKLFEYNARNQITLWGPSGNVRTPTACTHPDHCLHTHLLLLFVHIYAYFK